MDSMEVKLSDEQLSKLQKLAPQNDVSPEELLQSQVDFCLSRDSDFGSAVQYLLQKNAELYRRLA